MISDTHKLTGVSDNDISHVCSNIAPPVSRTSPSAYCSAYNILGTAPPAPFLHG